MNMAKNFKTIQNGCYQWFKSLPPCMSSQYLYNSLTWLFPPPSPTFNLNDSCNDQHAWMPQCSVSYGFHQHGFGPSWNISRCRGVESTAIGGVGP